MQQDLDSETVRGHSVRAVALRGRLRQHAELVRVVKEIDGIFANFQRRLRELDRDPESESVRTKVGLLKREVSERLPTLLQPVGASLDELEFWQPDISSAFYEIWLDPPLLIQGPTAWLRYLGQWRAFVLEALEPEADRTKGEAVDNQRNVAEPAAPSAALEFGSRREGTKETERHFSPKELAELWGLDQSTVRRIFRDEPGVLRIPHLGRRGKRDYTSLRIPDSVAARVHERRSRGLFKI